VRKKGLLLGLVLGLAAGILLVPVVARPAANDTDRWTEEFFTPLAKVVFRIRTRYVEEVTPEQLLEGAYQGVLSKLDDYSSYIPTTRVEEFEGDARGEFGGLGIQISFKAQEKILKVEQPIPGTPAVRAGVLPEDVIVKIYDEPTGQTYDPSKFDTIHDAVRVLRGKPGTNVTITVVHKKSGEKEDITIKREIIAVPGVVGARIVDREHKIGYIYVARFHEHLLDDLKKRIKELKDQGMQALVLDLRFNPGGLLNSAVGLADVFLENAVVVSTEGRSSPKEVYRTRSGDVLDGAPMVVLVNRYSASASEIVAGAIKDNRRGILVGETTFGKGSVQTVFPVDGGGALRLTTARYYTPAGVCIEKTGVRPDIEVKLSDEDTVRLIREISRLETYQPEDEGADTTPLSQNEGDREGEEEVEPFSDVQLERAVDILKAILIQRSWATEPVEAAAAQ